MGLDKYKGFLTGETLPAENANSIDPENIDGQVAGFLTGGTNIVDANFDALLAGANNGAIKINVDGTVHDNVAISLTGLSLASGLLSYWKLDEASGNAVDVKGVNTLTNSNVTYTTGKIGNCAVFNGSNARLMKTSVSNMPTGSNAKSVSAWVKFTSVGASKVNPICNIGYNSVGGSGDWYKGWDIFAYENNSIHIDNANNGCIASTPTLSANVWYHVVVTYHAGTKTCKVYINGSLQTTTDDFPQTPNCVPDRIVIGQGGGVYGDDKVDEVGIWNWELTQSEVDLLYNGGNGNQLQTTIFRSLLAQELQNKIRTATSGQETVVYSTDHFVITSGTANRESKILKLMAPTTGTNITGAGYLDLGANATETAGTGEEFNLVRLDGSGQMPGGIGSYSKIVDVSLESEETTLSSGVFGAFKFLKVILYIPTMNSADTNFINFNGDTGSNYYRATARMGVDSITTVNGTTSSIVLSNGYNASSLPIYANIDILNYPTTYKYAQYVLNSYTHNFGSGYWSNVVDQITEITLTGNGTMKIGTRMIILGMN